MSVNSVSNTPNDFAQIMLDTIRKSAREKALELDIKSGTIRITVYLASDSAAKIFAHNKEHEQCILEHCYTIQPHGVHAIIDSEGYLVSTYGYSALKAACGIDMIQGESSPTLFSGPAEGIQSVPNHPHEDDYKVGDCGFVNRYGMIGTTLMLDDQPIAHVLVTVSGGTQEQDLLCSSYALGQWVDTMPGVYDNFYLTRQTYPKRLFNGQLISMPAMIDMRRCHK